MDRIIRLLVGLERHSLHAPDDPAGARDTVDASDHFHAVQAISAFFGYTACGFLIDRFGRRPVLFLYFFIGAFFHLWFALASGIWLYFAAAAVGWVNPGVFGSTGIYVSELHPTRLRATAVGWFFGIGRIGSFLAPAVIGYMLAYGLGAYVLYTFAVAYLVAAIALWFVGVEDERPRARGNQPDKSRNRLTAW